MDEVKKSRLKIFLWDQFIRPVYLLFNIHMLQAFLLAVLILNILVWKNMWVFLILVIALIIIWASQIIDYYKSGDSIANYRKYKSEKGQYKDYRKLTKVLKKEKKYIPSPTEMELNENEAKMEKKAQRDYNNLKKKEPTRQFEDEALINYHLKKYEEINTGKCEDCGKELVMDNGGNWTCDCNNKNGGEYEK